MRKKSKVKLVIGRKDKADFPELHLRNIDVKIDTGAYTSVIHCHDIEVFRHRDGRRLRFSLLDPKHPAYEERKFVLPAVRKKSVKSSFGQSEDRYVIRTRIKLFGMEFDIDLALTDRSYMNFPVLLGRRFLRKGFVVDVNKYDLSYKEKRGKRR